MPKKSPDGRGTLSSEFIPGRETARKPGKLN